MPIDVDAKMPFMELPKAAEMSEVKFVGRR